MFSKLMRDAILLGQHDTVQLFIDEGVYINALAPDKNSEEMYRYIHFAAYSGNLKMVELLVEHGADIRPHNHYYNTGDDSGIRAAVKAGHVDIVHYLLEKGAKATGTIGYNKKKETFIAHAAKHNRPTIIELLIRYGAGKEIQDSFK